MGRRSASLLAITVAASLLLVSLPSSASTSQEQDFVSRINAERRARGLSSLSARNDLTTVARRWAARMAEAGRIFHNTNLPNQVSGWRALGENVGRGPSVTSIHDAMMASATHRSITLDPDFNQIGVGVVADGGTLYVSQVFARRSSSATAAPRASTRTVRRTTAPRPAPVVTTRLTGRIWHIDVVAPPITVTFLEQLIALDAS